MQLIDFYTYGMRSDTKNMASETIIECVNDIKSDTINVDMMRVCNILSLAVSMGGSAPYTFSEILEELNEHHSEMFENDDFGLFVLKTAHSIRGHITLPSGRLNSLLQRYYFIHKVDTNVFELTEDFDINIDSKYLTANWAVAMIEAYQSQLPKIKYDEDTINTYFQTLRTLSTFDYRKGINDYGVYVLFFGIDNMGHLMTDTTFMRTVSSMKTDGMVYKLLVKSLGQDELDYILAMSRMIK